MYQRVIFTIVFQIAVVNQFFAAVDAPQLKCISVDSNDDITLTWIAPNDPLSEFVSYSVYQSTSLLAGYSVVSTISNINQNTYTFTGANLNSGTAFYLVTRYDEGAGEQLSSSSDTLQPILITVNGLSALPVPLESQAQLSWNKIHNPKITSHSDWYRIYRKLIGGVWELIDSTQFGTESYLDSVAVCNDSAYYRIEVADGSGCASISKVAVDEVGDETPPNIPQLDSVSIDPLTGNVQIGWAEGSPGDIDGYIIILELSSGGYRIDTVWGMSNTFLLDGAANPSDQSEIYSILAFDSCWGGGTPNTSAAGTNHKTIFLSSELSPCDREVQLNWSHYEGWSSGIGQYHIYASENGGPATLLTSLSGNNSTYVHQNLNGGSNYCYLVRAVEAGGTGRTSSSNLVCRIIEVPNFPQKQYLNYVTVRSETTVEVSCYIDLNAAVQYYEIERSINGVDFEVIEQIELPTTSRIIFVDSLLNTSAISYSYRVVAIDICGNPIVVSNTSSTLVLVLVGGTDEYVNEIRWSSYSDWSTFGMGVSFYNIYKSGK